MNLDPDLTAAGINEKWKCDTCSARNPLEATACLACEASNARGGGAAAGVRAGSSSANATAAGRGNMFGLKPGEWKCKTCATKNPKEAVVCVVCGVGEKERHLSGAATCGRGMDGRTVGGEINVSFDHIGYSSGGTTETSSAAPLCLGIVPTTPASTLSKPNRGRPDDASQSPSQAVPCGGGFTFGSVGFLFGAGSSSGENKDSSSSAEKIAMENKDGAPSDPQSTETVISFGVPSFLSSSNSVATAEKKKKDEAPFKSPTFGALPSPSSRIIPTNIASASTAPSSGGVAISRFPFGKVAATPANTFAKTQPGGGFAFDSTVATAAPSPTTKKTSSSVGASSGKKSVGPPCNSAKKRGFSFSGVTSSVAGVKPETEKKDEACTEPPSKKTMFYFGPMPPSPSSLNIVASMETTYSNSAITSERKDEAISEPSSKKTTIFSFDSPPPLTFSNSVTAMQKKDGPPFALPPPSSRNPPSRSGSIESSRFSFGVVPTTPANAPAKPCGRVDDVSESPSRAAPSGGGFTFGTAVATAAHSSTTKKVSSAKFTFGAAKPSGENNEDPACSATKKRDLLGPSSSRHTDEEVHPLWSRGLAGTGSLGRGHELIEQWLLRHLPHLNQEDLTKYTQHLVDDGFDSVAFIEEELLEEDISFMKKAHRRVIVRQLRYAAKK